MLRVLYIVTAFQRFEGDVITPWMLETIVRLKRRGVDVEVFAPSYKGSKDHRICDIVVRRFRYFFAFRETLTHEETTPDRLKRNLFYKLLVLFYICGGLIGILKVCSRKKYDIIHVHWPFPHGVFGYASRFVSNCKIVLYFHGVSLRWVDRKMPWLNPLLRWMIRKADAITVNSSYTESGVKRLFNRQVHTVPYGTTLLENFEVIQREDVPQRNILFVGRLVERKGVIYLIEALPEVLKEVDVRLLIVGEGPEEENIRKAARDLKIEAAVQFLGKISSRELDQCYRIADVFCLPAIIDSKGDTEGLGVVLVEALNYGKVVIATGVGGIVDIVKDGKTGLLVPEKDPHALANALLKVLKDDALRDKLERQGRRFVRENYGWDIIIDRLIEVYNNVVENDYPSPTV